MKDYKSVFKELENNLMSLKWWTESWTIYNRGVYMQVAKENWFNDNQGGIHFETYVEKNELAEKLVPIHMHVEDEFPKQDEFVRLFTERARPQIEKWKGYKVYGTGYLICQRKLPLDPKSLSSRLIEEYSRLRDLEPLIDKTIEDILS
ncbi:hypothetical protein HY522_10665 [bacterium]|nr:hypothetical protein [bacterium]